MLIYVENCNLIKYVGQNRLGKEQRDFLGIEGKIEIRRCLFDCCGMMIELQIVGDFREYGIWCF